MSASEALEVPALLDRRMRARPRLRPSTLVALVADETEDDAGQLAAALVDRNVQVMVCADGADALLQVGLVQPDVVLVAASLPVVSGVTVVDALRRRGQEIPVIVGVGPDDAAEAARALSVGASACIRKPWRVQELLPMMQATRPELAVLTPSLLRCGPLEMDDPAHEVRLDRRSVTLPLREFEVLRYLLRNHRRAVGQQELLDEIWGTEHNGDRSTLAVHINRLRGRLAEAGGSADLIQTLRGVGYRMRPCS